MKFLQGKNILVISPEAWGTSMLSKHHYARTLARSGNRVWFLQPPGAPISETLRSEALPVILLKDIYLFRGARFFPDAIRKFVFRKLARRMQNDTDVKFDLIWNFDNSRFFDLDCFEGAFGIHHRMDFHYVFQNERASRSANLCLGVIQGIVDDMKQYNPHSYFIQHGYAELKPASYKMQKRAGRLSALYIGNLLVTYINWSWIHALVLARPDVDFYFAGSYGKGNLNPKVNTTQQAEVRKLKEKPNVILLGERTPEELHAMMEQVDILFAAYRAAEFPDILANSHKVMSYIGSGKPVVCHEIREYAHTTGLLHMAHDKDQYLKLFDEVAADITAGVIDPDVANRKAFAAGNTYDKQIARIDELISSIVQ